MADHVAGSNTPASSPSPRVAELLALCAADYKAGTTQRTSRQDDAHPVPYTPAPVGPNPRQPLHGQAADQIAARLRVEAPELATAIRVAQRMLATYGRPDFGDHQAVTYAHGSVTEALRILLHALNAEPEQAEPAAPEHTPVGPGCGAPATVRVEGYSPTAAGLHGSLDLAVYACQQHATDAETTWIDGRLAYRSPSAGNPCGHRFDYTTLGGGQ
ncbi:hypothetical protein [Streptomyces scabiei]|uniref:hypothetical protein n=1 Tax=Streptomyces scabiei TaxID=1930 RepID=UPI000765B77A|nr:hypothetical protein [Streptomyces scabiei]